MSPTSALVLPLTRFPWPARSRAGTWEASEERLGKRKGSERGMTNAAESRISQSRDWIGSAQCGLPKLTPNGSLIVSLPGKLVAKSSTRPTMWTNPKTGSKSFCVGNPDATLLVSIDLETLDLRDQRLIEDDEIVSMRQRDGHLYAAARFKTNCRLDSNAKLVEITNNLESKTIFQTSNVSSVEVTDFEITPEHFVLVGRMRTFLPASSTRLSLKLEDLSNKVWSDSFWENNENQMSALVLVLAKNGSFDGDRVFSGVATRAIQNIVAMDSSHFVTAGSTFNERGWIVSFSLQRPSAYWDGRVGSWLKSIWADFGFAR
jgi:hypothetical protein